MARSIFIIASIIIALAVGKLSNAFTIIHQKIKQTQLPQSRQSSPRDADQSFQLNLNLKDDESPFWFITFEEENDSSLKEDESSDFQSPFWFATFEEDDDSPLQSEDESSSFTPPQHEQPLQPPLCSVISDYSSDVNRTTARKNNGFIFRDFALAATSNLLAKKLVVAHNKNTTAAEAVVESVWTTFKGAALHLVAATSILVKTIEAAEKLHLKSSVKLAVALAIAGGDIFVKGGGSILREIVADGVTKKPLGEKIAGVEIETRPRTGTDAVLSESSEALQADEQITLIEGERDQVENILELPKDDVRATTTSSAKNQSDEELIGLDDQSVEDSTTGLPKLEDGIAETFIIDTERETVNKPPDVASVFDLELLKPVEDDVIDMSTSSAIEESEDELIERDDQSVVENTAGLSKLEDSIAETFICDAETDVASAFGVELPKPVMDEVLEMSTSRVIEESEEELIERDDLSEMLIERHDRPARDNINEFPKVEDRSLLEQRLTYEKDQDELIITTATAATWSEPAKAENDSLDTPVSYPFHRENLERRLAYSKEKTVRTAERKTVAERKLLLEKRLTYEQEEKAKNVEREAVAVRRSLLERRLAYEKEQEKVIVATYATPKEEILEIPGPQEVEAVDQSTEFSPLPLKIQELDEYEEALTAQLNELEPLPLTPELEVAGEDIITSAKFNIPLPLPASYYAEEGIAATPTHPQQQQQQAFPSYQKPATVWDALNDRFIMKELEGVSMKCRVYEARLKDPNTGRPMGDECIIKVSTMHQLMRKEADNYHPLQERDDLFIRVFEYHEPVNEGDVSAIIMEKGHIDIYKFMQKYGAFTGSGLQEVAKQVADILHHLHVDQQLVWTELKSGNFILTDDESLKAIDLESAIPQESPNIMYTATYAPPEFAMEDLCGRNMLMDFSFDIWSYGMFLYEIAMGELYVTTHELDKNDRVRIFSKLKEQMMEEKGHLDLGEKLESNDEIDENLKDLIRQCLSIEPTDRLTIQEVVGHVYFHNYEPLHLSP